MLEKTKSLLDAARRRSDEAQARRRRERAAKDPALLDFWREHGRRWAASEAGPEELKYLERLLKGSGRARTVVSGLRKMWDTGFPAADAVGWDVMGDELPPEAYLAFAEGAIEGAQKGAPE